MADPLSILGAVAASLDLAKLIWEIAVDIQNQQDDQEKLGLDYVYNSVVLKKFLDFFQKYQDQIDEETRRMLVTVTGVLNDKLAELKSALIKRKEGTIWNRGSWHFVKAKVFEIEISLATWIGKVNQILLWLPDDLREPLKLSFASGDYKGKSNPLSPIVAADNMRKLLKTSSKDNDMVLKLSDLQDDSLANAGTEDYFDADIASVPGYLQRDKDYSSQIHAEVAKLVVVLSHAETDKMHILKAYKYFAEYRGEGDRRLIFQYGIMYQKPRSVVSVLQLKSLVTGESPKQFSLNERIRVASEISSALAYIHAIDWVHEMIRSEHVLLCHNLDMDTLEQGSLGIVKICGFDASREVQGAIPSRGPYDGDWTRELYRHPDRQQKTLNAQTHPLQMNRFKQKHDIYSLGVVLLELGLWRDLESFMKAGTTDQPLLKIAEPEERRTGLRRLAEDLPPRVGDVYGRLVTDAIGIDEHKTLTATQVWSELGGLRV